MESRELGQLHMAEVGDDAAVHPAGVVAVGLGAEVVFHLREVLLGQVAAERDGSWNRQPCPLPPRRRTSPARSEPAAALPLTVLLRWTALPSAVYPVSTRSRQTPAPRSDMVPFMPEQEYRVLDHL